MRLSSNARLKLLVKTIQEVEEADAELAGRLEQYPM
jgi:hypothetical protein